MYLTFLQSNGKIDGRVDVSSNVFDRKYNEALIHQVVTAYLANARSGNRAQKDRGQVSHSTAKPYRQKGTGRARAGMSSSPLWRGGGRIFPNSPIENFSQKINKKMYRAGICSIFSELARKEQINIIENLNINIPKTKLIHDAMKKMQLNSVLMISDAIDKNLHLAVRNLYKIDLITVEQINPISLLHFQKVLIIKSAISKIEEVFG